MNESSFVKWVFFVALMHLFTYFLSLCLKGRLKKEPASTSPKGQAKQKPETQNPVWMPGSGNTTIVLCSLPGWTEAGGQVDSREGKNDRARSESRRSAMSQCSVPSTHKLVLIAPLSSTYCCQICAYHFKLVI